MKNLIYFYLLMCCTLYAGCKNTTSENEQMDNNPVADQQLVEKIDLIIDFNSIKGRSLNEVEKIIGKADNVEKVNGYPCEKSKCKRAFFKNGDIEIIFKKNKVDRVTINNVPNLTNKDNAIDAIGLNGYIPTLKVLIMLFGLK